MSSIKEAQRLLSQALDEFDQPGVTVAASVRRALRIAALRRDLPRQLWLQMELTDHTNNGASDIPDPAIHKLKSQIYSLLGAEEGKSKQIRAYLRWERNRSFSKDGEVLLHGGSISRIEQDLQMLRDGYGETNIPPNLNSADAFYYAEQLETRRAKYIPLIEQNSTIIEKVRSAVHAFLVETEAEIDSGIQESSLFIRAQEYVNSALQKIAPDALAKFLSAQDRLYSGNSEDLAHALTSCRRMIKALADALYPPTGEVITDDRGTERKMSDDLYRNRLTQYVKDEIGKHGQGEVVQNVLDNLGARLRSLDSLASKGVHDEVTTAEAETCVIWTYLMAADIVRLADGTSGWLHPKDETSEV